ncbi:hypothetical protein V6N13_081109 [Hibiscus sabdariffa]
MPLMKLVNHYNHHMIGLWVLLQQRHSTWIALHGEETKEKSKHFEDCMIQGSCEVKWIYLPGVITLGRVEEHNTHLTQSIGRSSRSKPTRSRTEAVPGDRLLESARAVSEAPTEVICRGRYGPINQSGVRL